MQLKLAEKIKKREYGKAYYHRNKRPELNNLIRMPIRASLEEKKKILMMKISSNEQNNCWEWQGQITKIGYGSLRWEGKMQLAHRVFYKVYVGAIIEKKQINHSCHNRKCVNPDHLYLGDQFDNMKDMKKAGRDNYPKGSKHFKAKLTEEQVLLIRKRIDQGETAASVSKNLKIARSTIYNIKAKNTWRHV